MAMVISLNIDYVQFVASVLQNDVKIEYSAVRNTWLICHKKNALLKIVGDITMWLQRAEYSGTSHVAVQDISYSDLITFISWPTWFRWIHR